jgi:hypothetical protein
MGHRQTVDANDAIEQIGAVLLEVIQQHQAHVAFAAAVAQQQHPIGSGHRRHYLG